MKKNVFKVGIKNLVYVVLAQFISLVLGISRNLMLPVLLGVSNFGYWQVYFFYLSYAGVFALGYNDGIYLKYGKFEYEELPKFVLRSSIRLFVIIEIVIMFVISSFIFFEVDTSKQLAILWVAINIPLVGLTGVLIYILQVTNQFKKYSFYTVIDKLMAIILILGVFLLKTNDFIVIIVGDTISRITVLGLMLYSCRAIVFGKGNGIILAFKETLDNISIGMKLMLANFSGMLVLGYGRFLVERTASVEVYGTYSFAISTINLVLVMVAAIGLVIYPTLNRLDKSSYSEYFKNINQTVIVIISGLLILAFPLKVFINSFMKDYVSVFQYLQIVFAILYAQSKMQILINPFYKLLRKEKKMLYANIFGVIMATIIITPIYMLTKSVSMVAMGTLFVMMVRLYLSELYLKKELGLVEIRNMFSETLLLISFILVGYIDNFIVGMSLYLFIYTIYLINHRGIIKKYIKYFMRG